jgi:sugar/nucleoside kinase (ribokinase family)
VSLYLSSAPALTETSAQTRAAMAASAAIILDLSAEGARLIPEARESGSEIWVDLHDYDGESEYHRPFLEAADVVFCSDDRLTDPERLLRACISAGARLAVCTRGADGAIAVDAAGELHEVAAEPVDVIDTNGAGDAFFTGVLDALLDGVAVDAALSAGARNAARVLGTRHLHPLVDDALAG